MKIGIVARLRMRRGGHQPRHRAREIVAAQPHAEYRGRIAASLVERAS